MEVIMASMILTPLVKIGANAGLNAAKKLFKESPVERAVAATAAQFPECEVSQALKKWCESNNFADLLDRFKRGDHSITPAAIVNSFITISGFYNASDTESTAES